MSSPAALIRDSRTETSREHLRHHPCPDPYSHAACVPPMERQSWRQRKMARSCRAVPATILLLAASPGRTVMDRDYDAETSF
jgi:hypothetical protein